MDRIQTLFTRLPDEIDGVLILSSVNRQYYTGMRSSAGILLATREKAYFLIDFRYIEAAKRTVQGAEVQLLKDEGKEQLQEIIKRHNIKTVGVESGRMSIDEYLKYKEILAPAEIAFDSRVNKAIEQQRMIKSQQELEAIEACQRLTDETFTHILGYIQEGRTEREIALEMEYYMRKNGGDDVSFSTIVVSGVNSSLPHGVPTDKKVEKGDFVTMDFGVAIGGYRSDMTRTVAIGQVDEEHCRLYDTVLKAQLAALDYVAVGKKCSDVDKVARDLIYAAGYEGCFGHGLGHSVGLEIHENPRFSKVCQDICQPGLIMTVEPGIYLEGRFGCRIEDMIYITESGIKDLTHSPKELICL